jgi:DNA-binding LacI/PurR family transcriptional regulator
MPRRSQFERKEAAKPDPTQRLTMRGLAKHLGVSPATVSIVLNDSPLAQTLSKETRARVIKAAKDLDYRPNYFARYLNNKRSFLIGILTTSLGEGYDSAVLAGIERELSGTEYAYFVGSHLWSQDLLARQLRTLTERGAEGLIAINASLQFHPGIPTVTIGAAPQIEGIYQVSIDNALGSKLALEHLYSLGHRHIAYLQGPTGGTDTRDRWNGVVATAATLGLVDPNRSAIQLHHVNPSELSIEEGYAATRKLLATQTHFTALVAFNDMAAMGAIMALREQGFRIPEQMSVIGFDDIRLAAMTTPPLSTIRQPLIEMGISAARTLVEHLEQKTKSLPAKLVFTPELIVRGSTGRGMKPSKSTSI